MNTLRRTFTTILALSIFTIGTSIFAEEPVQTIDATEPESIPAAYTESDTISDTDSTIESDNTSEITPLPEPDTAPSPEPDTIPIPEPDEADTAAETADSSKTSPDTGINDVAAISGFGLIALAAIIIAKRKV